MWLDILLFILNFSWFFFEDEKDNFSIKINNNKESTQKNKYKIKNII